MRSAGYFGAFGWCNGTWVLPDYVRTVCTVRTAPSYSQALV